MGEPNYPVYIISKGRWESRLTSKALEKMKVPYKIVIEPQEYDNYSKSINADKILILPFSNLGQGSIPARNWVWEHSIKQGAKKHWILDDNIAWFARLNKNKKTKISNGVCFKVVEDFVDRYQNIAMAGLQYAMFTPTSHKRKPMMFNTRIYSCILLDNTIPLRWRGIYNEDTDLSIRILKSGYCTFLLQSFICNKRPTMTMKGGNSDLLYADDGRYKMALSLYQQHPTIVKIGRKYGRWQHVVDYRAFRGNKPILKENIILKDLPKTNNYNLKLKKKKVERDVPKQ